MAKSLYYVNDRPQTNGVYIVHRLGCLWMPYINSKTALGQHDHCRDAMREARKVYPRVNGCEICLEECHSPDIEPD